MDALQHMCGVNTCSQHTQPFLQENPKSINLIFARVTTRASEGFSEIFALTTSQDEAKKERKDIR